MKKNPPKGVAAALAMSVIIGLQFYFIKQVLTIFESRIFLFMAVRFLLAFLALVPFAKKNAYKKLFSLSLALLSLIQPFANLIAQTYGASLCDVTLIGYVSSLGPVITLILSAVVLKSKLSIKQLIAVGVVCLGTAFIALVRGSAGEIFSLGALLILIALLTRSLYAVFSKKISDGFNPFELSFAQLFWGMIYFSICALVESDGKVLTKLIPLMKPMSAFSWASLGYVSLLSLSALYLLNNYSLSKISVNLSGVMSNLTFVITLLSGTLLLKEDITFWAVAGSLLIIGGVIAMNKVRSKDKTEKS